MVPAYPRPDATSWGCGVTDPSIWASELELVPGLSPKVLTSSVPEAVGPQIRGIGGRSGGDDEHARERIPAGDPTSSCGAADPARAGGDDGFSAALVVPPESPDSAG